MTPGTSHQTTPPPIVPKVPHSPISPTYSAPSLSSSTIPPLPPPPRSIPKPRRRILRPRNIFAILLLSSIAYGGAVWYSFQSDNFHDFFTEYVPGSTTCVHAIQDYQYKRRYPGTSPTRIGDRMSDLARKGPHISALHANRPEVIEKKKEDEKREQEEAKKKNEESQQRKGKGKSEQGQKELTIQLYPKTETPPQTSDKAKKTIEKEPLVKRDPVGAALQADSGSATKSRSISTPDAKTVTKGISASGAEARDAETPSLGPIEGEKPPAKSPVAKESTAEPTTEQSTSSPARLKIDLIDISPNDASLEKLTIALNDLIKSFNSTPTYDATSAPLYEFLKSSVEELNSRLPEIISTIRAQADSQIQSQAKYFTQLHQDLQAAVLSERNAMAKEWMTAFDKEREILQQRYNERLAEELKQQGQVNDQKLENELLEQAIALRRRWMRELQSQVEMERGGRLGKLANLEKALGELTGLHQDSHNIFSKEEKAKKTAIAVQALKDAALNRGGGFIPELAALKSLSNNDDLVRAVITSIDPEAYSKGIATQADLASRFQNLSIELRKIALLPPDAGVAGHAASWLLSKVMFRPRGYVRGDDVNSRLARIEALLESGQLEDAAREMNRFSGWGRELSRDWLRDARKRLEVIQAIDVSSPGGPG